MSQSTRFGKSLCGLISYDIRVSESAETPGSPANRRTNHERVTFPKAAGWIGLLALAVGLFQVAWAARTCCLQGSSTTRGRSHNFAFSSTKEHYPRSAAAFFRLEDSILIGRSNGPEKLEVPLTLLPSPAGTGRFLLWPC